MNQVGHTLKGVFLRDIGQLRNPLTTHTLCHGFYS